MQKFNGLKKMKQNGGFSLVELIIVVAILAIIAAIAIPNIIGAVEDARVAKDISNAKVIADAVALYGAKEEGIGEGTYTIVDGSSNTTVQAILKEMNGAAPKPVSKAYKGDGSFKVTIAKDTKGHYSIVVKTSDAITVFPTPDK